MKENRIEDIRRRLEGHETKVPEGLWESIADALDSDMATNDMSGKGQQRRRGMTIPMRMRVAMAVAAVWLVGFFVFLKYDDGGTKPATTVGQTKTAAVRKYTGDGLENTGHSAGNAKSAKMLLAESTPTGKDNAAYIYNKVSENHERVAIKASSSDNEVLIQALTDDGDGNTATPEVASEIAAVAYNATSTGEDKTPESEKSGSTDTPKLTATTQNTPKEPATKTTDQKTTDYKRYKNLYEEDYNRRMTARSERSGGRIDIGASVSNGLMAYNGTGRGMSRPAYSIAMSDYLQNDMECSVLSFPQQAELLRMSYANLMKDEEVHHDIPVQFGFAIRYSLNDRWAVETGITYTHLRSTFSWDDDSHYSSSVQRLNYIGIPVGVTYSIWTAGGFNLYASVGGAVAKCVDGKIDTETVFDGKTVDYATFKESTDKPWQLSMNGSVGIQYSFVSNLSLYAEPSINYYFDDGSSLDTYYSKHPWAPGIKVGLRLQIK